MMGRMVDINVQPVIDGIRSKLAGLVISVKALRGKPGRKSEGHVLIIITCFNGREIQVDIDVMKMMSNKHYLDTLFKDIGEINAAMEEHAFNQRRIVVGH